MDNRVRDRVALWKSGPLDSREMTGLELPVPLPHRLRLRRPGTRGGITWLAVLLVIGAFLAVQVGRQVYANWQITQQAGQVRAQIAAIQRQNDTLQRELDYLHSDAFVSVEARRLQNLGRPGEQVLIIPPGAEQPLPAALLPKHEPSRPMLEQWLDLFFGH